MPCAPVVALPCITEVIGGANGEQWTARRKHVRALLGDADLALLQSGASASTDLTGSGVYSMDSGKAVDATRYDVVNRWQTNFLKISCALDGTALSGCDKCSSDEALFGDFHAARSGAVVLDVGCNTGKNMSRAKKFGGEGTEVYGIEYSQDSVALARLVHGSDRVIQGDASSNFVDEHCWQEKFTVVQCTAVLQHLTPSQVVSTLGNFSRCLRPGGEVLLTFKDSPTKDQLARWGMSALAQEVFTAEQASTDYFRFGYVRAAMWDDDYYPGVTSSSPPSHRDQNITGLHHREFYFYSLEWVKFAAARVGLFPERVEVHADSKIPRSALHWMLVLRRQGSKRRSSRSPPRIQA